MVMIGILTNAGVNVDTARTAYIANNTPSTIPQEKRMPKTDRDKAAEEMQQYVKVKRCLEETGLAFVGVCVTHARRYHIASLQAGHFIGGRRNAVLFDQMNIHCQCYHCNVIENGEHTKYRKFMVARHGEEWVVNRELRAKRNIPNARIDFVKLRKGIKRMTEKLYRKHGFKKYKEILQLGQG